MPDRICKVLAALIFPILIVAVAVLLSAVNFTPDTWLTGWDTLHPELNLPLNLERVVNGVWREDQGLGAVAAHSHMSEMPRILLLWLFSALVPLSNIRYVFLFLCLIAGPLGVYAFLKHAVFREESQTGGAAAFLGALMYLLNLGTLQHFFVPFEMFAVQYAALGWLFLFATKIMETRRKKDIVLLALVSWLAAPMAYASLLWYAYALALAIYLAVWIISDRRRQTVKKAGIIVLITLAVNAFWLFPQWYFVATHATEVAQAKINRLFSPEAFLHNKEYGTLANAVIFKNFLFSWTQYDPQDQAFKPLLESWINHLDRPLVSAIGYLVFVAALYGMVIGLRKNNRVARSLFPVYGLALLMMVGMNPPFEPIYNLIRDHITAFREALRFPYTKFSILLMFTTSVFFGIFLDGLMQSVMRFVNKRRVVEFVIIAAVAAGLVGYTWPMFQGRLINPRMRIAIPDAYSGLFRFMNSQEGDGRVAPLPMPSFWGWEYHDWGYEGAGFIWFGMKQPVLARDFDRWNPDNEQYYLRMSSAIYGNDSREMKAVADIYNIRWLVIDESVIVPGQEQKVLKLEESKRLLAEIGAKKVWENDFLSVYEYESGHSGESVSVPAGFTIADADTQYARKDVVLDELGNYISFTEKSGEVRAERIDFPFADLNKEEVGNVVVVDSQEEGARLRISRQLPVLDDGYQVVIPQYPSGTLYITGATVSLNGRDLTISIDQAVEIELDGEKTILPKLPEVFSRLSQSYAALWVVLGDQEALVTSGDSVRLNMIELKANQPFDLAVFNATAGRRAAVEEDFAKTEVSQCWTKEDSQGLVSSQRADGALGITSLDAAGCYSLNLVQSNTESLMKVELPYRSDGGARPHFCVVAEGRTYTNDRCEHKNVFYHTPASEEWAVIARSLVTQPNLGYWLDIAGRPSSGEGERWTIWYKAPQVIRYPIVGRFRFAPSVWEWLGGEKSIPVKKGVQEIAMILPTKGDPVDLLSGGRLQADNCDLFNRGWGEKFVEDGVVRYRAGGMGASCDFFLMDTVSAADTYLLNIEGKGIQGRGTKLYLFNRDTDRTDLEVLLPEGEFSSNLTIPSWPAAEGLGYTMNIETRSFGRAESENVLVSAVAYKIPLEWMTGTKLLKRDENDSELPKQESNVHVLTSERQETFLYSARFKVDSNEGLVVLPQEFETGWRAYLVSGSGESNQIFPPLGAKRIQEHVLVNGWANGWLIGQGTHSVVMVFMPQYLEYLGFLILAGLLVILLFPGRGFTWFRKAGETLYTTIVRITGKAA